jgi:hypothetical protein
LTFLFKLVIYTLIFCFVVYVLKMIARLSRNLRATLTDVGRLREVLEGRASVSAEMLRCQTCGSFVAAKEAVTLSVKKNKQHFCSQECMHKHIKHA